MLNVLRILVNSACSRIFFGQLLPVADDHLPIVRAARKAFVSQMETMMLDVAWRPFHHVCENFPREKGHIDCTGGKFYIWGGGTQGCSG
eukprot:SAG11_NODE_2758_length_3005_cov_1.315554_1_plen_89_part_00